MTILKNLLLALLLIAIILFLGKVFLPENALRIGSGFHAQTPALTYPMKLVLFSAVLFFGSSFFWKDKKLMIGYFILLGINLIYLFYCMQTYVE